jgi:hypothetical protein
MLGVQVTRSRQKRWPVLTFPFFLHPIVSIPWPPPLLLAIGAYEGWTSSFTQTILDECQVQRICEH